MSQNDLNAVGRVRKAIQSMGEKFGVIVGINRYEYFNPLRYGVADATDVHAILIDPEYGGFNQRKTQLLTEGVRAPNHVNIREAILALTGSAQPDDTILMFFAGHGFERGRQSYLVPADASTKVQDDALRLDWIEEQFRDSRAAMKYLLLDSCYSGAETGRGESEAMGQSFKEVLERARTANGFAIFASCSPDETSSEDDSLQHGVFTYYLIEGLKGKADTATNGIIRLADLNRYVSDQVASWAQESSRSQHPTLYWTISGDPVISAYPIRVVAANGEATGMTSTLKELAVGRKFELEGLVSRDEVKEACDDTISQIMPLLIEYIPHRQIVETSELNFSFPGGAIKGEPLGGAYWVSVSFTDIRAVKEAGIMASVLGWGPRWQVAFLRFEPRIDITALLDRINDAAWKVVKYKLNKYIVAIPPYEFSKPYAPPQVKFESFEQYSSVRVGLEDSSIGSELTEDGVGFDAIEKLVEGAETS